MSDKKQESANEENVALFSKEWVRYHWDDERDQGPPLVQLVKLVHESHILIPGFGFSLPPAYLYYYVGSPDLRIITAFVSFFGIAYFTFFKEWWCSVVTEYSDE